MSETGQSGAGKTTGASKTAAAEAPAPEQRYEVEYLVTNAVSLLGSRRTLVRAALTLSDRKTHTIEEAKGLLKDLGEVKVDPLAGTPQQEESKS